MPEDIIKKLNEFGQSIWLDYISRNILDSGKLNRMIELGIRGITSNPTIFDRAVNSSSNYDDLIKELSGKNKSIFEIYDELTINDIRDAADRFLPVYKDTGGKDGLVSLEINPELAYDAQKTVEEGKRLYEKIDKPNVMFKVPSTDAGFPAIEELLSTGINVNITLIFSLTRYEKTAQAYLNGIEKFIDNGGNPEKVHSVASVFVSRIDTAVDNLLKEKLKEEKDEAKIKIINSLMGKAGVSNSDIIYERFRKILSGDRFKELRKKGARIQRVLWGSTSTKNPEYSDIKYVTELMAEDTVNTVPERTLNALLDHGKINKALTGDASESHKIINQLKNLGISIDQVCEKLLKDGVNAFINSFKSLLSSIEDKKKGI